MSTSALVIVESPAKANTIKKFLGKGFKVVASVASTTQAETGRRWSATWFVSLVTPV